MLFLYTKFDLDKSLNCLFFLQKILGCHPVNKWMEVFAMKKEFLTELGIEEMVDKQIMVEHAKAKTLRRLKLCLIWIRWNS